MLKKITYSFLFFLGLQLVLFSCCKEKTLLVNLQSLEIYDNEEATLPIASEDFMMYLNLIYNYEDITFVPNTSINFNTALATTCPDDVYVYGSVFTNINITADTVINGVAAGESLNSIMKFAYYDIEDLLEISEFYDPSDNNTHYNQKAPDTIILVFNEDLASQTEFKLSVTVETSNSNTFSVTSNTYLIE
ncbi:hypothetical protein [Olleya sp. R77988]|uniref:hypothetical protein n=1 Tax=Olleya sp. R77988 TaxID=3093875 RepID=UPI0037C63A3A